MLLYDAHCLVVIQCVVEHSVAKYRLVMSKQHQCTLPCIGAWQANQKQSGSWLECEYWSWAELGQWKICNYATKPYASCTGSLKSAVLQRSTMPQQSQNQTPSINQQLPRSHAVLHDLLISKNEQTSSHAAMRQSGYHGHQKKVQPDCVPASHTQANLCVLPVRTFGHRGGGAWPTAWLYTEDSWVTTALL